MLYLHLLEILLNSTLGLKRPPETIVISAFFISEITTYGGARQEAGGQGEGHLQKDV